VRTIKFSVPDEEYEALTLMAHDIGLRGLYLASKLSSMIAMQLVGAIHGATMAVLVPMTSEEYGLIDRYVKTKKGFIGPRPMAAFILKAAFDIMAKYPARIVPLAAANDAGEDNIRAEGSDARAVQPKGSGKG